MSYEDNYILNSGGSSPRIFRKQVDLTALLNILKIDIFLLPIGEKKEVQKIPIKKVLILLGQ